jgi:uncharacterized protein
MVQIGEYNTLEVVKQLDFGIYLKAEDDEILVPKRYVPENIEIGQMLEVFIYRDSEDRIIATTLKPLATANSFALMEVVETNKYGVFVNWGLPKDLFVPFQEQNGRMQAGKKYIIWVYIDQETERIVGSARIERFLNKHTNQLQENQQVVIIPFKQTDLGLKCIIDNKYEGMLFENMQYGNIQIGKEITAYIWKIRENGLVDLSLKPANTDGQFNHITNTQKYILKALEKNDENFLPLHDKSSPEEIFNTFNISKRDFKQAIGGLYKANKIKITPNGIQLEKS